MNNLFLDDQNNSAKEKFGNSDENRAADAGAADAGAADPGQPSSRSFVRPRI